MKRLLAVIGRDVSRSPSPLLHESAARACGLELAYIPLNCADDAAFKATVDALRTLNALGANVTIPYKRLAHSLCDELSPVAQELGAVNTLSFGDGGRLRGDNTDAPALLEVLGSFPEAARLQVQILGDGGAARAAAWAVKAWGAERVVVCARSGGEELAAAFGFEASKLGPLPNTTLLLSTLPADGGLAATISDDWIAPKSTPWVCDVAYGEPVSPLVALTRAKGCPSLDGRWMLVSQAARSLSIWTEYEAESLAEAMSRVLPFDSNPGPS